MIRAFFFRDLKLALRAGGGAATGLAFFFIIVATIPFIIGPDLILMQRLGPAFLWIGALLAILIGLERLYQADTEDGSLDLILLSGQPLVLVVFVRTGVHWIGTCVPLILATPVLGILLNMPFEAIVVTFLMLSAGTPALALVGSIGAALTASLRRGGLLLPVLVLPITLPVLIFGIGATQAAIVDGRPFLPPFMMLVALTLLAGIVGPVASALALRLGSET